LAFSTVQGSGGAPDSFVGTSGVDAITIIDSLGNFFLGAQEANDVATFVSADINDGGVITNATLKGGQGSDTFSANAGSGMAVFNAAFINGNSDADNLTFNSGLLSASTVQGGQGNDNITVGGAGASSSLINGNKDADTLLINSAVSVSSVFGGQGNDTITQTAAATSSVVSGDDGNDAITTNAQSVAGSTLNGGAGNDTINAAAATSSVEANGDDGNDVLTSNAGRDTLNGGAGNDTITGGAGADNLTGGTGINQFAQVAASSVAASATTNNAGVADIFAAASTFTATFANGVDVITDFNSTSTIDAAAAGINRLYTVTGGVIATAGIAAGDNLAIQGNFNAGTGVFTASLTGSDILFGTAAAANAIALGTSSTVLVGGANGFTINNVV